MCLLFQKDIREPILQGSLTKTSAASRSSSWFSVKAAGLPQGKPDSERPPIRPQLPTKVVSTMPVASSEDDVSPTDSTEKDFRDTIAGVQFAGIISSEIPKRRHPVAFQMKGVHLGYPPLSERMTDAARAPIAVRPAFRSCIQYHVSLFLSILT